MNNYEILKMSKLLQSLSRILDLMILHLRKFLPSFLDLNVVYWLSIYNIYYYYLWLGCVQKNKIIVIGGWGSVPKIT